MCRPRDIIAFPRMTFSDRVCCPREMITCHSLRHPSVYSIKGRRLHYMPDSVWPSVCFLRPMNTCNVWRSPTVCMLSNCNDGMPCLTSSNRVFIPRVMIKCHTWQSSTMYIVQVQWSHVTLVVVRSCVLSKGYDNMSFLTSSNCVLNPREMNTLHAR